LNIKYKSYWRKSGLKGKWGDIYLSRLEKYKPKNILEIGVFCGVTARNNCDFLNKIHGKKFSYTGIDLFGSDKKSLINEIEPKFLKDQKFSNPLKNIFYNYILKEKLNKRDTNIELKKINLSDIDFVFIDGGHSYETVINDLETLYKSLKGKNTILLCDDYGSASYISDVKKAIDHFTKTNNLSIELIKDRFAEIIT